MFGSILNAIQKCGSFVASTALDLIQSGGKVSSTKFFLTLFNFSLLAIIWHKELTQPQGVSGELLVVAFGLLAGNYQVSKIQRFKASGTSSNTTPTTSLNTQHDADKENKNGEQ